jgi:hypothetical protein
MIGWPVLWMNSNFAGSDKFHRLIEIDLVGATPLAGSIAGLNGLIVCVLGRFAELEIAASARREP